MADEADVIGTTTEVSEGRTTGTASPGLAKRAVLCTGLGNRKQCFSHGSSQDRGSRCTEIIAHCRHVEIDVSHTMIEQLLSISFDPLG